MELIRHIIAAARPRQWIKNLGLLVPLLLDGKLFYPERLTTVSLGVLAFCFLSSSNYILNDILDAASDKVHPYKRHRPIARNAITRTEAIVGSIVFGVVGLLLSGWIGVSFLSVAVAFVVLHYLSYFFFRRVAVLDVLMLASGYILRIMAGEQAAHVTMSVWLFLAVLAGSLLLAIGKRRNELSIVQQLPSNKRQNPKEQFLYTEKVLDSYVAVFSSATFLAYTYFTFLSTMSEGGFLFRGYTEYLLSVIGRKWMMITVPFVLYAIMRYLQLVYAGKAPLAKAIFADRPLLFTLGIWVISVLFVVYGIGG